MEKISEIAPKVVGEFVVSKRKLKQAEAIEIVRTKRESGQQDLMFGSRPFILCGLPVRRPPKTQLEHIRHNGKFFLRITGDPKFGLPFGQDRLLPLWVADLAFRQQSRVIIFDSAATILKRFDLPQDGRYYKRLVEGFKRIFTATIFFGTEEQLQKSECDWNRSHFFDRLKVWYSPNTNLHQTQLPGDEFQNVVVLSEHFYNEVKEHPVPVDLNVVKAMVTCPAQLDFYCWLVWRCYTVKGVAKIPLAESGGLMGQLGISEKTNIRDFRKQIRKWLDMTRLLWPECPASLSPTGEYLRVAHRKAISAGNLTR